MFYFWLSSFILCTLFLKFLSHTMILNCFRFPISSRDHREVKYLLSFFVFVFFFLFNFVSTHPAYSTNLKKSPILKYIFKLNILVWTLIEKRYIVILCFWFSIIEKWKFGRKGSNFHFSLFTGGTFVNLCSVFECKKMFLFLNKIKCYKSRIFVHHYFHLIRPGN